jgi:hypothetical protein
MVGTVSLCTVDGTVPVNILNPVTQIFVFIKYTARKKQLRN